MKTELTRQEVDLLRELLTEELEETRVEMHHAKNIAFKSELQAREKLVHELVERFKTLKD